MWHGRYNYLELDFHAQNAALKINSPLSPNYKPGALYIRKGDEVAIYDPKNKPAELRLWR